MATTGEDVLNTTLALIGESNDTAFVSDYKSRAVPLLNLIFAETYAFQRIAENPKANNDSITKECFSINSLKDEITLDWRLVRNIIPYALAARLILEEDPERAAKFDSEYEKRYKSMRNGKISPIKRVWF